MNDTDDAHGGEGQPVTHTEDAPALLSLDLIASRLKLYATTIAAVGVVVGATVSGLAWWTSRAANSQMTSLRAEVSSFSTESNAHAVTDSLRFERVMGLLELAVVAIAEPPGSAAQRSAIATLRAQRHYIQPR